MWREESQAPSYLLTTPTAAVGKGPALLKPVRAASESKHALPRNRRFSPLWWDGPVTTGAPTPGGPQMRNPFPDFLSDERLESFSSLLLDSCIPESSTQGLSRAGTGTQRQAARWVCDRWLLFCFRTGCLIWLQTDSHARGQAIIVLFCHLV